MGARQRKIAISFYTVIITITLTLIASAAGRTADTGYNLIHQLPDNVQLGQLENGMPVLLVYNPTSTMTGVNVQVHAGSVYEDFHTSGMSHMLEHLLFNGTTRRTQEQLYDEMDSIGGYNNANTSSTYVNYMVVVSASELLAAMDIQSDMLFNSILPPDKFEKERGIVLEEMMQSRGNPNSDAGELIDQLIFGGSSMGMPTLGTVSTIENMQREEVFNFYKNFYVPNNMQLSVVGSFDPDSIWQQLERYYGGAAPANVVVPPVTEAGRLTEISVNSRKHTGTPELHLVYNAPAYNESDYAAFEVLLELLDAPTNPVRALLLEQGIPLSELYHRHYAWEGFSRLQIGFEFSEAVDFNQIMPLIDQALNEMATGLVVEDDLITGIVNTRLTEELRLVERPHNLGVFKGDLLANAGFEGLYRLSHEIQLVDKGVIQQVIDRYITGQPHQIIALWSVPEATAEEAGEELATRRVMLTSGSTLIAHDRGASDLFALHLLIRNRSLHEPPGQEGIVNLLHELLLTTDPTDPASDPQAPFNKLGIIVKAVDLPWIPYDDYYTNGRFSFIRVECRRQQAEQAIELLTDLLYERELTGELLTEATQSVLRRLSREDKSARTIARRSFRKALLGDHPLTQSIYGTEESLEGVTLSTIQVLRQRYFNPANLIFSVVSAIPAQEVADMLNSALPVPVETTLPELPPTPLTLVANSEVIEMDSQQAHIYEGYVVEIDPLDALPLELLGSIISNRLAMDLRETRGMAYSVGAWISAEADRAEIGCYIGTRVENLEEVVPVLRQSITQFDVDGITQTDIDIARQAILGRMQMRLLSSIGQAYSLGVAELNGDFNDSIDLLDRYNAITLEQVQAVSSYLGGKPIVEVIVK
ncbi:MAG: insulinase family protein [Candidatus Delongbacteria bacterium]|nr:insulinase family protein [Candidatus Delongbacteria bacterium]